MESYYNRSVTVSLRASFSFSLSTFAWFLYAHVTWDGWGFPDLLMCQRAGLSSTTEWKQCGGTVRPCATPSCSLYVFGRRFFHSHLQHVQTFVFISGCLHPHLFNITDMLIYLLLPAYHAQSYMMFNALCKETVLCSTQVNLQVNVCLLQKFTLYTLPPSFPLQHIFCAT